PGAFQTSFSGTYCCAGFVTKFDVLGSTLVYSTYLHGSGSDYGFGITVDVTSNAYVTGPTFSSDFPTTAGDFQTALTGSSDAFVSKLSPAGSALVYSTFLGGSGQQGGYGIAIDASGNAHVTGLTTSSDFPTTPDAFQNSYGRNDDVFVTKFDATGSALLYSTYLGGTKQDFSSGIAVDASGNVYVAGTTYSSDFPTTPGAFQTTYGGGGDAFISKFSIATGGPAVSLIPTSLTFAAQPVGTFSSPLQSTLTNTGGAG